uniref:Male-enhanced antigen 1 n=1 Tax=Biomphalaria glabrata TaxID=6526 RepID=A0A2C9KG28_BIOGL
MAPIPEKNQDKPSDTDNDESEINSFSNANQIFSGVSGSSDDEDNYDESALGGYTLLPQDPEDDEDEADDHLMNADNDSEKNKELLTLDNLDCSSQPEASLDLERGASASRVIETNESYHPAFLAKFPDGKVPSYLQVLSVSKEKEKHLWNQKPQNASRLSLDSVQESKILGAMSGFSLPKESIPDWAKDLTDDQWNCQILKHLRVSGKSAEKNLTDVQKQEQEDLSTAGLPWVAEFLETEKGNDSSL